jgi:hypothetical protein
MSTNVQIAVSAGLAVLVGFGTAHTWPKAHVAVPIGATVATYVVARAAIGMATGG